MNRSAIKIGDLAIRILSADDLPFLPCQRFLPFQTAVGHADITWEFHFDGPAPSARGTGRQRQNHWLRQARQDGERFTIEMNPGALTVLDFRENRAVIFFNREFAAEMGGHGVGPAMLAPFLPHFDACLLHAAAVVLEGRTAVFLAPDEGGKTTAARLAPGGTILGDDQVLVRRSRDGFRVSGTPWGLHVDGRLQAPLAGFFVLEKARNFSMTPLTALELAPYLWEEVKESLPLLPRRLKKKLFEFVCEMASAVPARRMAFAKDHIDWNAVNETIAP